MGDRRLRESEECAEGTVSPVYLVAVASSSNAW